MTRRTLGQTIRAARLAAGLSQRALADRSDIHWNTIARYERDEMQPSVRRLVLLAAALSTTIDALLP